MSNYTPEQQAENRAKWVRALRSGDYRQTARALARRSDDGMSYCCLGVACELAVAEGVLPPAREQNHHSLPAGVMAYEEAQTSVLPGVVQDWLGLAGSNGLISESQCLSSLNDEGKTFAEIADVIERGEVALAEGSDL